MNLDPVSDLVRTVAAWMLGLGLTLVALGSAVAGLISGNSDWFLSLILFPLGLVFFWLLWRARKQTFAIAESKRIVSLPPTLQSHFPNFCKLVEGGKGQPMEEIQPAISETEIQNLEGKLGVPLPDSYKEFLRCCGGLWLLGGAIKTGTGRAFYPFFHDQLSSPSRGMLCFADFCMEADGDQVLFDVKQGLKSGEYPVMYYSHETNLPVVRKLEDSFRDWLEKSLTYEAFRSEE